MKLQGKVSALATMTVKELKVEAKAEGLTRYSALRRDELIEMLTIHYTALHQEIVANVIEEENFFLVFGNDPVIEEAVQVAATNGVIGVVSDVNNTSTTASAKINLQTVVAEVKQLFTSANTIEDANKVKNTVLNTISILHEDVRKEKRNKLQQAKLSKIINTLKCLQIKYGKRRLLC